MQFSCKSVVGGWQTLIQFQDGSESLAGPVFNATTDLWAWQEKNLRLMASPTTLATMRATIEERTKQRDALRATLARSVSRLSAHALERELFAAEPAGNDEHAAEWLAALKEEQSRRQLAARGKDGAAC